MDKFQARQIIRETFENPFDKSRFLKFIKNLLNSYEIAPLSYKGNIIYDAFEHYVSSMERIGKYSDGNNKIDILIVRLRKVKSVERARTMQRNFIARYLNGSRGGEMKDAALVAFVSPNDEDWRFSLVKMDYKFDEKGKVKEEFTPARRWSFLVGVNEKSHTAQSRLIPILENDELNPTLTRLEEAFNIETVTKEFFKEYRDLFIKTKKELDKVVINSPKLKTEFETKGVDAVNFSKKLLGQIIFLYFLQKKGWFGVPRDAKWGEGSKQFLRELLDKKHGDYKNFFNDILEPLFYDALRNDRSHDDHYYPYFTCKIPFLNGGLFDPIGIAGGYDWVKTDITLPNELFSNVSKTKQGDTGDGIFDIFDRYNFTVIEDEPLEKEVAIDPELLGKAYEKFNAIRPDNFDEYLKVLKSGKKGEESKFNKQYGVFYTPREIVHYMCRESLINYLASEFSDKTDSYQKITTDQLDVFGNKERKGQLSLESEYKSNPYIPKEDIETLINYGELLGENEAIVETKGKETETYYHKLPESIRKNANLIDEKLADILICDPAVGSGAFPVGMMHEIVSTRNILSIFLKDKTRTIYKFKRDCIEKSLYGVDIDPGAVEIAKLRLWLSLVVDEDDITNIKPLPNLDYKIVCGNSLLGVEKNLFNNEFFAELEKIKPIYFNETNPTKKQEYKKQIDELILKISNGHKDFDFEVYFSEVFHYKKGFDVVIANPPYVDIKGLEPKYVKILFGLYLTATNRINLYSIFIDKSLDLLNNKGGLVFINPNSLLVNESYQKIRQKILPHVSKLIKLPDDIFESAIVETMILLLNKGNCEEYVKSKVFKNNEPFNFNKIGYNTHNKTVWEKDNRNAFSIFFNNDVQNLLSKIANESKTFSNFSDFSLGITPYDKYKDHSQELIHKRKFHSKTKLNNEYVPLISGENIQRYFISNEIGEYLYYGEWLGAPRERRFFTDPRIIVRQIISGNPLRIICGYTTEELYYTQIGFGIIPKDRKSESAKFFTALLNSSLINFYHSYKFLDTEKVIFQKILIANCKEFPIKDNFSHYVSKVVPIVDKILKAKQQNPQSNTKHLEDQIDIMVYSEGIPYGTNSTTSPTRK